MPRKKVVKKPIKQKQKVKVSQNVKVIVGDVKRKQVRKSTGQKTNAKPPIVLNISNPQPYNNMFMEYFKKQLQDQQPAQANTLNQHERINERAENEASRAGALNRLDQEPDDVAREMRRQRIAGMARYQVAQAQQRNEAQQVRSNLRPVSQRQIASTPLRPRNRTPQENLMASIRANVPETPAAADSEMLAQLRQQQSSLESAMDKAGDEQGDDGSDEQQPVNYSQPGGPGGAGAEETKTEIGDWNPTDEVPLSELDALYGKPSFQVVQALQKKKITDLRAFARELKVPWSKGGKPLNKDDLISNLEKGIRNGTPQRGPGRPKKGSK